MIRHHFRYHAPRHLEDVLDLLAGAGTDAAIVGGGTWLVPNMSAGVHRPLVVIDLRNLSLRSIATRDAGLFLEARVTYADIESSSIVREQAPLLNDMASQITGGAQIRNQGTVCGSACYANPSSDVPGCLVALDAQMHLVSRAGPRVVPAVSYFKRAFRADRRDDELLLGFLVPKAPHPASVAHTKLKVASGSWPIVTASCVGQLIADDDLRLRTVIGGVAEKPLCHEVIIRKSASLNDVREIANEATAQVEEAISDELAPAHYRRAVAPTIVARCISRVLDGVRHV